MFKKNKIFSVFFLVLILFSSCHHVTTDPDLIEEHNKFQQETVLKAKDNYLPFTKNAKSIEFMLDYTIKKDKETPSFCILSLLVVNGISDSNKGSNLWLYIDGKKEELLCFYKGGWDQQKTSGYLLYCNLITNTKTTPYRMYSFILDLSVLNRISKAESVWFELEAGNDIIEGDLGYENFRKIQKLIQTIDEKKGEIEVDNPPAIGN